MRIVFFIATFLFACPTVAQQVEVTATVSGTTIGTEEGVSYKLEVQGVTNRDVERPKAPSAEGLVIAQPIPSTQQSMSIVNGRMSQSIAFEWIFYPEGEGNAEIGVTQVVVKGKTYSTKPIAITVVPQSQRPQRQQRRRDPFGGYSPFGQPAQQPAAPPPAVTDKDIFIRAIPSDRNVYRNEQVNIEYHLYYREGMQLRQSRLADSWDAEGFWREELDVERRPIPRTVVENGIRYNMIVLKRVAVFPTRIGSLSVDPLKIEVEASVPTRSGDPFDQFFSFRSRYEPVEVSSSQVTIQVKELPSNAPSDFLGAVGAFRVEARVDQDEVEVGEPVQVELVLSGTGNLATIEPPHFEPPGVFEQYDPQVDTQINRTGQKIRGTKTLTYVLVPRSNGVFQIPQVSLSFFNPQHDRYESLNPRPTTVRVTGTPSAAASTITSSTGLPIDDIAGLLTEGASWNRLDPTPFHQSSWVYILLGLPLLALVGLGFYQRHADRLTGDQIYARNRRAHPVAKKHLKKAEALLVENDARSFYEEIERALLSFIGNRLNIADKGLTYQQLDSELDRRGVGNEVRKRLLDIMHECDRVRYAPVPPDQNAMNTACDRAYALIVDLDQVFSGEKG